MTNGVWWDNEQILAQLRDWLTQTAAEIDALDEPDAPVWQPVEATDGSADEGPHPGWLRMVESLTALRQELKLQTKSTRGLEQSVQDAQQALYEAIRQFESIEAREEESAQRAVLPLLETLASLDEALWRGDQAFEATHRKMTQVVPERVEKMLADEFRRLPAWRRWLIRPWEARIRQQCAAVAARASGDEFSRLYEGYRLIRDRVARELEGNGLQRLEAVGRQVDPACMTVVALAEPNEGLPETVVEQIRPGYAWRGQLIRFAEVRAVPSPRENNPGTSRPQPSDCDRLQNTNQP